jgi:hypothetical protein
LYPTQRSAVCTLWVHIFVLGVVGVGTLADTHLLGGENWLGDTGQPAARVELFNFASHHVLMNSKKE